MSRFSQLESKLEARGYSKKSAGAITYSIGKKKYGKKGMARLAAEARKRSRARY